MSTAARKARKRAGIQFQHPVKISTPVKELSVSQHKGGKFDYMPSPFKLKAKFNAQDPYWGYAA